MVRGSSPGCARTASSTAMSSAIWLVPDACPPLSCVPSWLAQAQPMAPPGLRRQEPSVLTVITGAFCRPVRTDPATRIARTRDESGTSCACCSGRRPDRPMILGMTTTYDDADLFSDAFTGFRGVAPSRTPLAAPDRARAGRCRAARRRRAGLGPPGPAGPAAQAVDPASLVPVLAESQRAADVIAASDRADLLIYPETHAPPADRRHRLVLRGGGARRPAVPGGHPARRPGADRVRVDRRRSGAPCGSTTSCWSRRAPPPRPVGTRRRRTSSSRADGLVTNGRSGAAAHPAPPHR